MKKLFAKKNGLILLAIAAGVVAWKIFAAKGATKKTAIGDSNPGGGGGGAESGNESAAEYVSPQRYRTGPATPQNIVPRSVNLPQKTEPATPQNSTPRPNPIRQRLTASQTVKRSL